MSLCDGLTGSFDNLQQIPCDVHRGSVLLLQHHLPPAASLWTLVHCQNKVGGVRSAKSKSLISFYHKNYKLCGAYL